MIARPTWERPLRRRLREKREPRGKLLDRIKDCWGLFIIGPAAYVVLAVEGGKLLGAGGGGTGIGIASGLVGVFLGLTLRARWLDQAWLTVWTPADRPVARRIQTREAVSRMIPVVLAVMILSMAGSCFTSGTGVGEALAATSVTMISGFLLAGGRLSMRILIAGVIWIIGYCILSPWLLNDSADLTVRIVKGAMLGWLPVMPWSMPAHGAPAGTVQWLVLGGAFVLSLREWWKSWHELETTPMDLSLSAMTVPTDAKAAEEESGAEISEQPSMDDEQRKTIRQQVAFAWFGLAGYMPDRPMPMIDRLIWRWLTPRQRMISTLGSHDAFDWFAQTKWAALSLALLAAMAWFSQATFGRRGFNEWLGGQSYWGIVGLVALAAYAVLNVWPSRRSRFKPWLELMEAQGIGHFPAFAVLPVCPGDWLRAAAKEWAVRSAWMAALWTPAIAVALPAFSFGKSAATMTAWLLLPWLLGAALFPLSGMNRLIRAVSGPILRSQGFSRTIPSILLGLLCPTASAAAEIALGTEYFLIALLLLAFAAGTGWASLVLTLNRCRNMRFDLKPKPLH